MGDVGDGMKQPDKKSRRLSVLKRTGSRLKLRRQADSFNEGRSWGSTTLETQGGVLRFPGHKATSRFVHLSPSASIGNELMPTLTEAWGITHPSAIISVPSVRNPAPNGGLGKKATLQFTRGLAEAVRATNAWIVTDGITNGVNSLIGHASQVFAKTEGQGATIIGICPLDVVHAKELLVPGNKSTIQYSATTGVLAEPAKGGRSVGHEPSYKRGARSEARWLARAQQNRLDPHHSHFILVEGGPEGGDWGCEIKPRGALERFISENDLSNDGVPTPTVVLLLNGDAHSLETVLAALDPSDPVTGAARPVLVIADSGGAAEDIFYYCNQDARVLPVVGQAGASWRTSEYCKRAAELLPRILELGKQTGANSSPQLSLFGRPETPEDGHEHQSGELLNIALEQALLNACRDRTEEVLLAVAWGEPLILLERLEQDSSDKSDEHSMMSLALEMALKRRSAPVARTLLDCGASPAHLRADELFTAAFNRYGLSHKLWDQPSSLPGLTKGTHLGLTKASLILAEQVDGYRAHVCTRRKWRLQAGLPADAPTWTDLTMWAVLCGEAGLAELLWPQSKQPLRTAVLASSLCRRLSQNHRLQHDAINLVEQSERFEDMACRLLDAIPNAEQAFPVLLYIPCLNGKDGLEMMWQEGIIDLAENDDGGLSVPCMRLVAHRHCQHAISSVFTGDYPGSQARIAQNIGLTAVIAQAFCLLLPGLIVQTLRPTLGPNVLAKKPITAISKADLARWAQDGELSAELSQSRESLGEETVGDDRDVAEMEDANVRTSESDLFSGLRREFETNYATRGREYANKVWHFYSVPQVKFAQYFVFHILYLLCLVGMLVLDDWMITSNLPWAQWMRHSGRLPPYIHSRELMIWIWTGARALVEFKEIRTSIKKGNGLGRSLALYVRDSWNQLDVAFNLMLFITAGVRLRCATENDDRATDCTLDLDSIARCGYALAIILCSVRTLQYLRYFESIGVLIIVLGAMTRDVQVFFIFIMVFSVGFGWAFIVLLPGNVDKPIHRFLGSGPFWSPFWGLYGNDNLEAIEGYLDNESYLTSFFSPFLLWVYMMIANVVLINLLIAQMSSTYEDVTHDSKMRWQYARAGLVLEFKDSKCPLPPPLNLLWTLLVDVPNWIIRTCSKGPPPPDSFGFKLIRPIDGEGLTQAQLQWEEKHALRASLRAKHADDEATMENRLTKELANAHAHSSHRFESINGRLDKFEETNARLERRLARLTHLLEDRAGGPVAQPRTGSRERERPNSGERVGSGTTRRSSSFPKSSRSEAREPAGEAPHDKPDPYAPGGKRLRRGASGATSSRRHLGSGHVSKDAAKGRNGSSAAPASSSPLGGAPGCATAASAPASPRNNLVQPARDTNIVMPGRQKAYF